MLPGAYGLLMLLYCIGAHQLNVFLMLVEKSEYLDGWYGYLEFFIQGEPTFAHFGRARLQRSGPVSVSGVISIS